MTIPTSQLEVTTRISEQEKGGYSGPQFRKYCTVLIRESYGGTYGGRLLSASYRFYLFTMFTNGTKIHYRRTKCPIQPVSLNSGNFFGSHRF